MKKLFTLLVVAMVATQLNFVSAICIGCGCNQDYKNCLGLESGSCYSHQNPSTGEIIVNSPEGRRACCEEKRSACHSGFGIITNWWGGSSYYSPVLPGVEEPVQGVPGMSSSIYVAFSINGGILGSHNGGQYIKQYHLLTPEELSQLGELQPVINKYLSGIPLTQSEILMLDLGTANP